MDSGLKKILRAVSLELRHVLEGRYDDQGRWLAGDLERRLNELGVWRDRPAKPLAELSHLSAEDKAARYIVDAYLRLREEAGVARNEAVAEFVREAAYTWANRLFALRCMEARGIIDEVILQKENYGGRSMVHSRFARRNPGACAGEDDGLFAVLFTEFAERAKDLPVLFNPYAPAVALRPSVTALKKCIALLSGREAVRGQEPASDAVFEAPDAFGWAYQYWNTEEKDRVFEMVRTKKGAKIEGADIIPATCIYTEPYMVKFLVQNSLGALWMGMHPESKLYEGWEYYVKDADRAPVEKKPVAALTFLDPACGSGHFLLEAFDLLYAMYEEEGGRGSGLGAREGAREGARGSGLGTREGEGNDGEQLSGVEGLAGGYGIGGAGVSADVGVSQAGDVWTEQSNATSINIDSFQPSGGTQPGLDSGVSTLHLDRHGLTGGIGNPTTHGRATGLRAEDRIDPASHQDRRTRQDAPWPTKIPETEAGAGREELTPSPQPLASNPVPSPQSLVPNLASSPQPLTPSAICAAILNNNLFGIDIDERAVQIAEAALWMRAKEKAPNLDPAALDSFRDHLVATNIRLPKGKDHLQSFLKKHPEDQLLHSALEAVFQGLANAHELGSLLQIEEPVEKELRYLKAKAEENKGKLEQQALFAEVAEPRQGELPLGVGSYEQWKTHTLDRLRTHFGAEAEAADPVHAFFSQSAEKGLVLFDLLSRRYDIVAANPPYMGLGNMGLIVRKYVERHYPSGKRDLYAAFILRCRELAQTNGYVGMVTRQSWMFLRNYSDLRALPEEKVKKNKEMFSGLLREASIEIIAHLGSGAFSEISGEVVSIALFCFRKVALTPEHRLFAIKLTGVSGSESKAQTLARLDHQSTSTYVRLQAQLLRVNESPILYWFSENTLVLLASSNCLGDGIHFKEGLNTTNNTRFVRWAWEVSSYGNRWFRYAKGGGYRKWHGLEYWAADWEHEGARMKRYVVEKAGNQHWSRRLIGIEYFTKPGLTYSLICNGNLSVRFTPGHPFDSGAVFVSTEDIEGIAALLNSRFASYILRGLCPDLKFREGYVGLFPARPIPKEVRVLVKWLIEAKCFCSSKDLCEYVFSDYGPHLISYPSEQYTIYALILAIESILDALVFQAYALDASTISSVNNDLGLPAGLHPLIVGYDTLPKPPSDLPSLPQELFDHLGAHKRVSLSSEKLTSIKDRLRALYVAGRGAKLEDGAEDSENRNKETDEDEEDAIGAHIPIPAETFIEELSQKLEFHPISVYWLLEEMQQKEGLVCPPELRRHTQDDFSVKVLRLLGHRWPKQIEAGEQIPDWADRDGIIPITEGSGEKTLVERARERISEDFSGSNVASIEREFEEIIGTSLEKWLAGLFFKRHISQFKKRPIAWQVELGTRGQGLGARGKRKAAGYSSGTVFSCLVYYHKLDTDLLPKIRSQYIGLLKSGYETESRALGRIESPTTDQSARKVQLTNWIDDLKALDEKLSEVIVSGFGPEGLQSQLRQFAVDDAMLALKARWLQKLADVVQAGPLESWKQAACETELHSEFLEWIQDTLTHLDHYCSAVGPKAPDGKTLSQDPDSTYLSALICREAEAMVSGTLTRACQKWWKQFNEAVIAPIRRQIAERNEQIKLRKEERELVDLQTTPYRRVEIEREIEDLKDQVSALKDEQAQKVAAGQRVRAQIEGWTCPEAERWEPWLAAQPLYDQISSLDERRSPPHTVAEFIAQESAYAPDINDGVRVNIAPLQRAGLLPAEVIAKKDVDKAIADRAEWRADERRWCREGKLPYPGWWKKQQEEAPLTLEAAT